MSGSARMCSGSEFLAARPACDADNKYTQNLFYLKVQLTHSHIMYTTSCHRYDLILANRKVSNDLRQDECCLLVLLWFSISLTKLSINTISNEKQKKIGALAKLRHEESVSSYFLVTLPVDKFSPASQAAFGEKEWEREGRGNVRRTGRT